MTQALAVIAGVISIIVGLWRYFGRKAAERRRQLEQAERDLQNAMEKDDISAITAAVTRINRLR